MPRRKGQLISKSLSEAFWRHVIVKQNACWVWKSCLADGYGQFHWNGKTYKAHRVSFELHKGDRGDLHVLHTCDNRACTNPQHLYLGTNADNIRDRDSRDRVCHGERHHEAKLSTVQIQEIVYKAQMGYTHRMLAAEYKCNSSHITRVVNGQKRKRG